MVKRCPNCKSYDTLKVGKVYRLELENDVYICKECFKIFYDKDPSTQDKTIMYNPNFKRLYLEQKIPEIAEHKNFEGQDKICENDKTDLKIDFWLMERKKKKEENETSRTDNTEF